MGTLFTEKYNKDSFGEDLSMDFMDESLGIESGTLDALNEGKYVLFTAYNPSTARDSVLELKVPHDRVEGIFF